MSPDGMTLAVRTYSEIFFYAAETGPSTCSGQARRAVGGVICKRPCFLGEVEPQGEAIDYLDDKTLVLGSETSQGRQGICTAVPMAGAIYDLMTAVAVSVVGHRCLSYAARVRRRASTDAHDPGMTPR